MLFFPKKQPTPPLLQNPIINPNCTEFEVNNWVISEFVLEHLTPVVGTHPFPLDELSLMSASICRLKPTHLFEWGTHVGKSARIFWETISYFQLHTKIYSIDLPDDVEHTEHPRSERGKLVENIPQVKLLQGDGVTKALEIYASVPKCKPLFFLDGDHEYKSIKRELQLIFKHTKKANILIHDTFYQSKKSQYNIGPYKAVTEFHKKHPKFKAIATKFGLPGMTLLYQA
jgi:cephalosporin hydroxylase